MLENSLGRSLLIDDHLVCLQRSTPGRLQNSGISGSASVPEVFLMYCMQGTEGDVSDALSASIPGLSSWFPSGFIKFIHTPGHLRGHVSYIHQPTSSLIAGDIEFNAPPPLNFGKKAIALADPLGPLNQNTTELRVGLLPAALTTKLLPHLQ